jgi:exportin-1
MHESHPGVQDMACKTFLKICTQCSEEYLKPREDDVNEGNFL